MYRQRKGVAVSLVQLLGVDPGLGEGLLFGGTWVAVACADASVDSRRAASVQGSITGSHPMHPWLYTSTATVICRLGSSASQLTSCSGRMVVASQAAGNITGKLTLGELCPTRGGHARRTVVWCMGDYHEGKNSRTCAVITT